MTQALINKFDIWVHYDSDISSSITFSFNARVNWIGRVSYIVFEREDDEQNNPQAYTDYTAFLEMQIQNATTTNIILQGTKGLRYPIVPIRNPHTTPVVDAYIKGTQEGAQQVTFCIKDKSLNEVPTKRLVLTLHIQEDTT